MRNGQTFLKILMLILLISPAFSLAQNATEFPDDNVCIMFFYGMGCPHCAIVDEFLINEFLPLYVNRTHIYRYEVYNNPGNSNLFRTYAYHYNFTFLGIPTIIVGDNYFIGDVEIIENLIQVVEGYTDGVRCKSLPLIDPPPFDNDPSKVVESPELPWYMKSVEGISRFVRFIITTILIYGGLVMLRKIYRFFKKRFFKKPKESSTDQSASSSSHKKDKSV